MTIAELIKELEQMPQNVEIYAKVNVESTSTKDMQIVHMEIAFPFPTTHTHD